MGVSAEIGFPVMLFPCHWDLMGCFGRCCFYIFKIGICVITTRSASLSTKSPESRFRCPTAFLMMNFRSIEVPNRTQKHLSFTKGRERCGWLHHSKDNTKQESILVLFRNWSEVTSCFNGVFAETIFTSSRLTFWREQTKTSRMPL